MKIAIIGTGNVGATLGRLWAAAQHEIRFGTRDPSSSKVKDLLAAAGSNTGAGAIKDAVEGADLVVLATPWGAARDAVEAAGDLTGKVVVDCTNPLEGLEGLSIGHTTSAAEEIAGWAKGARVVKAFNTLGAQNFVNPRFGGQVASMFICGDDAAAKSTVGKLAEELGFDLVDAGPLASARLLEPLAMLWMRLAYAEGLGPGIAFKLLRR